MLRLAPVLLLLLVGCQYVGDVLGAGAAGASGAATANPAVGIAVGVAVNAGIDATFGWIQRRRREAEQNAIAGEVAAMRPGERGPWQIRHFIPIGDEHGVVQVMGTIPNALTRCKALVFSVDAGQGRTLRRHWYATDACRDTQGWKWALAEPATERWDALQ